MVTSPAPAPREHVVVLGQAPRLSGPVAIVAQEVGRHLRVEHPRLRPAAPDPGGPLRAARTQGGRSPQVAGPVSPHRGCRPDRRGPREGQRLPRLPEEPAHPPATSGWQAALLLLLPWLDRRQPVLLLPARPRLRPLLHQVLLVPALQCSRLAQRPRVGQAPTRPARYPLPGAGQRLPVLRRAFRPSAGLRRPRPETH